jgi:hypothetical protein
VRLHYLTTPRQATAMRIDSRLTIRLLVAEARAARTASLHAYLVCVMAAREFVKRLGHHAERGILARGVHGSRAARSLAPDDAILQLLRSPDRGRSASISAKQRHDALRTLTLSQILTRSQRFLREFKNSDVPPIDGRMRSAIDASTVTQRVVAMRKAALALRVGTIPVATRLHRSHTVHACLSFVGIPTDLGTGRPGSTANFHRSAARPSSRQASAIAMPRTSHLVAATTPPRPDVPGTPGAPGTPGQRAAARLPTVHPVHRVYRVDPVITQAAAAYPAMPRSYADTPAATLRVRRTPRTAAPDAKRQTSQLQQQVIRQVTQELTQNTSWRGQLEQAVLAPRVLRELTDRVAGAIAGRQGLERYRRGL